MGVDTRARLNNVTDLEDLREIMHGYLDLVGNVKVKAGYSPEAMLVTFEFKLKDTEPHSTGEWRSMFVHYRGGELELSLGAGEKKWAAEAHHILRTILMVTGGWFQEYDHTASWKKIMGFLDPSDGIMFHVRNCIIKGELELTKRDSLGGAPYLFECVDVQGLAARMIDWEEKHGR